jgi:proline iminopeptidase
MENSRIMGTLYPPIEPYRRKRLSVSSPHQIYVEESGNPKGLPVLYVHGGPGGGSSPYGRRFFNPHKWRIILFDQRGCGESTPHDSLEDNTTWHLIDDMEAIRRDLDIEKWVLFGGSWGSTLSLAYAIQYPERCLGLILRGIFLLRRQELAWFYEGAARAIYPDYWEDFISLIPYEERDDIIRAYYKRLTDPNPQIRLKAAQRWGQWEMRCGQLNPPPELVHGTYDPRSILPFSRIECHYFLHRGFFPHDNWLLDNLHKITHLPATIVQGRYDMVCPPISAWELHRAWPSSTLQLLPLAGHSMGETPIQEALLDASNDFVERLWHTGDYTDRPPLPPPSFDSKYPPP